jgi:hypothetical protein
VIDGHDIQLISYRELSVEHIGSQAKEKQVVERVA